MPPKVSGGLFPTNQDLASILGRADVHSKIFVFFSAVFWIPDFQIPGFPDFQIPGFPDFQIPGSWNQVPGYGWLRLRGGHHSTALPDHRTQEIQGTRQYRENPISASPVWGTFQIFGTIIMMGPTYWANINSSGGWVRSPGGSISAESQHPAHKKNRMPIRGGQLGIKSLGLIYILLFQQPEKKT